MKIYFGQLEGEYLQDVIANDGTVFEHEGRYYDYVINASSEHFSIEDASGRKVLLDKTNLYELAHNLYELAQAITKVSNLYTTIAIGDRTIRDMDREDTFICIKNFPQ